MGEENAEGLRSVNRALRALELIAEAGGGGGGGRGRGGGGRSGPRELGAAGARGARRADARDGDPRRHLGRRRGLDRSGDGDPLDRERELGGQTSWHSCQRA